MVNPTNIECMFSNSYNTKYHDAKQSKQCKSTIDKTNFTCCLNCNTSPQYTCFTCLKLLQHAINEETNNKQNTKKQTDKCKLHCNIATTALLHMNLDEPSSIKKDMSINNSIIPGLTKDGTTDNLYNWINDGCPFCQDKKLPPPPPNQHLPPPNVEVIRLKNVQTRRLDDNNDIIKTSVDIELVIVKPVVDKDVENSFRHRVMIEGDGGNTLLYHSSPNWSSNDIKWRIIIKEEKENNGSSHTSLSAMPFGKNYSSTDKQAKEGLAKLVVENSPIPLVKTGAGKEIKNVTGGWRMSRLRDCRQGGPGGNYNGCDLLSIREGKASMQLMNTCARTPSSCVQVAYEHKESGMISEAPCFYRAVETNQFTHGISCKPAVLSSEAQGMKLVEHLGNTTDEKQLHMRNHLNTFQRGRVDTALILQDLSKLEEVKRAGVTSISAGTSQNIMATWFQTKRIADGDDLEVDETEEYDEESFEEYAKQHVLYENGEPVFVLVKNEYVTAEIVRYLGFVYGRGNTYYVRYGVGERSIFSEFDISGQPGRHQWDDQERVEESDEERINNIKKCVNSGIKDNLLLWSICGTFTVNFGVTGGHYDVLKRNHVQEVLENSECVPIGHPEKGRTLPPCGEPTTYVAGSLVFPRYNVAVVNHQGANILDLHTTLHLGVKQKQTTTMEYYDDNDTFIEKLRTMKKDKRRKYRDKQKNLRLQSCLNDRGCWFNHKFYPKGGVILDWQSKYGGVSTTAVRLRNSQGHTRQYRARARSRQQQMREIAEIQRQRVLDRQAETSRAQQEGRAEARIGGRQRINDLHQEVMLGEAAV